MISNSTEVIFLGLTIVVILRSLYGLGTFIISLAWLKKSQGFSYTQNETGPDFVVIIPALWEQSTLQATTEWFLSIPYPSDKLKIILVTTEKEFTRPVASGIETTVNIAVSLEKRYPDRVQHMHYTGTGGKKVHQLNFVLDNILAESTGQDKNMFVSFYDADSRPHQDTFQCVAALSQNRNQRVFQQSSVFFKNFAGIKLKNSFFAEKLLQANAIFQSRWTLAHEIPRILRQSYALRHWGRRLFLSHCVGHGLFVRKDLVRELRHVPADTMTEDLFLGFVLSLLGEPIHAIPVLESADSPDTLREMFIQKYVWFFGPLDHPTYGKLFLKDNSVQTPVWLVGLFVVKGLLPALAWLLSGWMLLFILVYPFFAGSVWVSALAISALCLYLSTFLVTTHSYAKLNHYAGVSTSLKKTDIMWISVLLFPVMVLHSLPPLVSLAAKFKSVCTGKNTHKPKIER